MKNKPARVLVILGCLAIISCQRALAQCPDGLCPVNRISLSPAPNPQSPTSHPAHCRVFVGDGSTGSGTLVDCNEQAGLVLTCSHLFDGTSTGIVVAFPDGGRFAARLIDRDRAHDLAALVIQRPEIEPVPIDDVEPSGVLTACGYGSDGRFRPVAGQITGRAIPTGAAYPSVKLSGAVRPGDSGGGVLDVRGRLVGVVWGQRDGETYFTCGQPLRQFLDRVLHREQQHRPGRQVVDVPTPSPGSNVPADAQAPVADTPAWQKGMEDRLAGRFGALDERMQNIGRQLGQLGGDRVGFFQGLSLGKLIVGTLGLSGPLAAAVVLAGGLIGRRVKQRHQNESQRSEVGMADSRQPIADSLRPIAVDTPPPPQRTVPETHFVPYERDAFARAHQWATEQVVRKYPGAVEIVSALDSLIKQQLNAG